MTPAEELLTLIHEALSLPYPTPGSGAWGQRTDLLLDRVSAVTAATATPADAKSVEFLRERIDATPVTYPTQEAL